MGRRLRRTRLRGWWAPFAPLRGRYTHKLFHRYGTKTTVIRVFTIQHGSEQQTMCTVAPPTSIEFQFRTSECWRNFYTEFALRKNGRRSYRNPSGLYVLTGLVVLPRRQSSANWHQSCRKVPLRIALLCFSGVQEAPTYVIHTVPRSAPEGLPELAAVSPSVEGSNVKEEHSTNNPTIWIWFSLDPKPT